MACFSAANGSAILTQICNVSNVPLCLAEVEKFVGLSSCSAQLEENLQDLTVLAHQEHWVQLTPWYERRDTKALSQTYVMHQTI